MLRGYEENLPDIKLVSNKFDLKAEKVVISWPEKHPNIFNEKNFEYFEKKLGANFPIHTAIYANETIGAHLRELLKAFKKTSYVTKIQYLKEDSCTGKRISIKKHLKLLFNYG